MSFNMEVVGDRELIRKLSNTATIEIELKNAAQNAGGVVEKRVKTYPPARPSSGYRRTRRLGNRWGVAVRLSSGQAHSLLTNPISYGPFVMSPQSQAGVHKGRWATTRKILQEQTQKIKGFYEIAAQNIKRKLSR